MPDSTTSDRTSDAEPAAFGPAMPMRLPRPVAVMGVSGSGSGKSTVGAMLAHALECRFLEGDAFHDPAAIARMTAGHPLGDEDRWPWLDRLGFKPNQRVDAERVS